MRVKSEIEILDQETRVQIINEIKGSENSSRKNAAYKRYLCYKDQTKQFVMEHLLQQFDQSTVNEMSYAIANISLIRKVVDKLARVYSHGVTRVISGDEESTMNMSKLEKELEFNSQIKKTNKFLKLQKNIAVYVKPCPYIEEDGTEKYRLKVEPLNPYLYDVVEDYNDRTRPLCFILSDYTYRDNVTLGLTSSQIASHNNNPVSVAKGDGIDQKIADSPTDEKIEHFIWWTKNYHFTTDQHGNITSQNIENPIKELPFVNFAIDQDGSFWAEGGDDLVDGTILVNSVMTHNQHVAITQGYGQFWMKGKNLPRNIKVGANKAILMEYQEGEPTPEIGYATASPQIDSLRALVESYVALLLTTNNLSTSSVGASLSGGTSAPSGVAMILDKAESMEDVQDQRQIFVDKEPELWSIINKWLSVYGDNLDEDFKGLELKEGFEEDFNIVFVDAPVIMSEKEKLDNFKLRKELGIDSMIDLIMKDNPQFNKQQAEEKLKQIMEQGIKSGMSGENVIPINKKLDGKIDSTSSVDVPVDAKQADINIQKTALNGAQVTSMVDVVSKVSLGLIPRSSGVEILYQAFNIEAEEAQRLMGDAGGGFTPANQGESNGNTQNNGNQQSDDVDDKSKE